MHVEFEVQYPSGAGRRVKTEQAARREIRRYGGRALRVPVRDRDDKDDTDWKTKRDAWRTANPNPALGTAPTVEQPSGTGLPPPVQPLPD